jgi:hypothetical protein
MNRILNLSSAALLLALAGTPCLAQPADDDANIQTHVITVDPAGQGTTSVSSMWSMSSTQDGRTIKLEGRNGVISAEVDGKAVPADRIVRDGNTVKLKDEKGEVIYQTDVPTSDSAAHAFTIKSGSPWGAGSWVPRAGSNFYRMGTPGTGGTLQIDAEPPTVMIGVQLLDPDASLRGHLGLKENESTLIGAIYEGLPAAKAGIEPYDIVVAIDGKSPASPETLRKALRAAQAGKSISLDVIHHGQKKTVTLTPEKYDREKLDKAKINAIAAATNTPSATAAIAGANPFDVWTATPGSSPMVAVPKGGRPFAVMGGMNNVDPQALAEQMREMVAQAQQQADLARKQTDEMRRQIEKQMHDHMGATPAPGMPGNIQDQMNEMMKELRSLHNRLDQQKPKDDKADGRS